MAKIVPFVRFAKVWQFVLRIRTQAKTAKMVSEPSEVMIRFLLVSATVQSYLHQGTSTVKHCYSLRKCLYLQLDF